MEVGGRWCLWYSCLQYCDIGFLKVRDSVTREVEGSRTWCQVVWERDRPFCHRMEDEDEDEEPT
jgi:hypothetical protein